jgi:hypothetical protein
MSSIEHRAARLTLAALACASVTWLAAGASAQSAGSALPRKATTVEALVTYPMFFHTQAVRVRGELRLRGSDVLLAANAREVLVGGPVATAAATGQDARVEVLGIFFDAGRLEAGDPRLRGIDVATLSQQQFGKPWPGVGELALIVVERVEPVTLTPAVSVRALALEPERFEDQPVTVTGRFRGRNLFGDQPTAPGRSRWDFVLQAGEASVWVTGLRPRGQGFNLDIGSRLDSSSWLEVVGTARAARGLVFVDATALRLAKPPGEAPPSEPVARVSVTGPPPEVVFSVPTQNEADVSPTVTVRLQFSRDVDRETLKGRLRAGYAVRQSEQHGEPQPPAIEVSATYVEASRALEIRFRQPLERFRTVTVELLEGIAGTDGVAVKPWTLSFTTGG